MNSSQLHPGIYGPLILSFDIAVDILANVKEVLGTGESKLKSGNIEDVKYVLDILGVKANLSQTRVNTEIHEQPIAVNEEDIKLEVVFESISDEDADLCVVGANEAKDDSYGQCYVDVENLVGCPDLKYPNDRNETVEDEQKCNLCDYSAISESDLNVHRRSHTVSNRSVLEKSNINDTAVKQHTCNICNKSLSQKREKENHEESSLVSAQQIQPIEEKKVPKPCHLCDKIFYNGNNLKQHLISRHKVFPPKMKIYNCTFPECSFVTGSRVAFQRHLKTSRSHPDLRKDKVKKTEFSCEACNKLFATNSSLKRHIIRRHS